MNVASLELSKELYELSGWEAAEFRYFDRNGKVYHWTQHEPKSLSDCPAYDLGYLLRKLPDGTMVLKMPDNDYTARNTVAEYIEHGDTPEDAACKLAIELFKQGVLTRDAA